MHAMACAPRDRWQNGAVRNSQMTDLEMEQEFRAWWRDSYSATPPGPHALITHLGWGRHLMNAISERAKKDVNT